jgi:hypothetical protein
MQLKKCAIQEQASYILLGTPGTQLTLLKLTISFQVIKKTIQLYFKITSHYLSHEEIC